MKSLLFHYLHYIETVLYHKKKSIHLAKIQNISFFQKHNNRVIIVLKKILCIPLTFGAWLMYLKLFSVVLAC